MRNGGNMKSNYTFLYERLNRRLREMHMSWGQLEERVEQTANVFVRVGYIKNSFKKRRRIPRKMFNAVMKICGEETVCGNRTQDQSCNL